MTEHLSNPEQDSPVFMTRDKITGDLRQMTDKEIEIVVPGYTGAATPTHSAQPQQQEVELRSGGTLGRPARLIPINYPGQSPHNGVPQNPYGYGVPPHLQGAPNITVVNHHYGGSAGEVIHTNYGPGQGMPAAGNDTGNLTVPTRNSVIQELTVGSWAVDDLPEHNGLEASAQRGFRERWNSLPTNRKVLSSIALAAVVVGGGYAGREILSDNKEARGVTTEASLTSSSNSKESKTPEFQLRPYDVPSVATYDSVITSSTMWNFVPGAAFDIKKAVAVQSPDPSLDFTATPELTFSLSIPYDPTAKTANALTELPEKDGTKRIISIDMSQVNLRVDVDPESLKDTTDVQLFKLSDAQVKATLTAGKLSPAEVNAAPDLYDQHKNHAETQAVGLAAAAVLADPKHKAELLSNSKSKIVSALGLNDPLRYSVRFINDGKFAIKSTAKNDKFPGLEALYPQATIADLMIRQKVDTRVVRIINAQTQKPSIEATLQTPKRA